MALFLLGLLLLAGAFLLAAYETMARVELQHGGAFMPAYDLWYGLWPSSLNHLRIVLERDLHPMLWDPLLVSLLVLPAWLLVGAPGALLLVKFRPHRVDDDGHDEDSLYVLENLVKMAREEGHEETNDDIFTDNGLQWIGDGEGEEHPEIRRPGEIPEDWQSPGRAPGNRDAED